MSVIGIQCILILFIVASNSLSNNCSILTSSFVPKLTAVARVLLKEERSKTSYKRLLYLLYVRKIFNNFACMDFVVCIKLYGTFNDVCIEKIDRWLVSTLL